MDDVAAGTGGVGGRRWIVPLVLHVSVLIAFVDRINLSIALPKVGEHYGWTEAELAGRGGMLMGAFYVAYALSNLLLSGVAARWGYRKSLIGLVVAFSAFTALGAPMSFSLALFVGTRVLLGIGEGVHFPMMNGLMKNWFPPGERSRANAIWVFGGNLATVLAPVVLVPVIGAFGWRTMLVGCGVMGVLITVPLLARFIFDRPREAPYVGEAEVEYIEARLEPVEAGETNWSFLGRGVFWLAVLGGISNNYCIYGILNWLPTYFVEEKGLPYDDLTYAASLPYAAGFLGFTLWAVLGDVWNRRIVIAAVGFLGASVGVFVVTQVSGVWLTVAAFATATLFQSAYISQEFAILQRILPASAIGQAAGIYNGLCVLFGGVGGTVLLGQIVSWTGSYNAGLGSVIGATLVGACVMAMLSRFVKY